MEVIVLIFTTVTNVLVCRDIQVYLANKILTNAIVIHASIMAYVSITKIITHATVQEVIQEINAKLISTNVIVILVYMEYAVMV